MVERNLKYLLKSGEKVKKVMFGDPNMRIKKSSPERRKVIQSKT